MEPRSTLAGTALVVLALGCRDNTTSTCAVTTTNQAYCRGDNERGVLGDGTTTAHLTPHPCSGGTQRQRRRAPAGVRT